MVTLQGVIFVRIASALAQNHYDYFFPALIILHIAMLAIVYKHRDHFRYTARYQPPLW